MIFMHKIGIIGNYESIFAFAALGIDIFPASTPEEAEKILKKLTESGYVIIYITEPYAEQLEELIEKYAEAFLPAIVPLPSADSTGNYEKNRLKKYIVRAVGSDITSDGE